MNYDNKLADFKNLLPSVQNILIVLPESITDDKLAAGLSLFLSLQQTGKKVSILTADTLRVSHANLFGVGEVKNSLPPNGSGNFVVTLAGVVSTEGASAGAVPALEKLDWYPQGADLNLVFHVLAGQKFEPTKISSRYEGESADLIVAVGAANPGELRSVFQENVQLLTSAPILNIDNNGNNTNFGKFDVIDPNISLSEMMWAILTFLGLPKNNDIASNIITGIYQVTANLTQGVAAGTFMTIGEAMQAGGKVLHPQQPSDSAAKQPYDLSKVFQAPVLPQTQPQVVGQTSSSQEERPSGEMVSSRSPEQPAPDWLTPKIYKGGSLG